MSDISIAARSVAEVITPHASRYLQQLCKHFQHKLPVTFDTHAGKIELRAGSCQLEATGSALMLAVVAQEASQLEQLQDVVARHLVRFAFREEIAVQWKDEEK